jgi:hypothetical protein
MIEIGRSDASGDHCHVACETIIDVAWQPPAISPDGSRIALVAIDESTGRRQIYVRALASQTPQS